MLAALIGSHGTGKTTVLERVKALRPGWQYLDEATRELIPRLGFKTPYELVEKHGIAFYEAIFLSQWSTIESLSMRNTIRGAIVVSDRSPIDNLAYYRVMRTADEYWYDNVLTSLARIYASSFDRFILFPVGAFVFQPDEMQRTALQGEHDSALRAILAEFDREFVEVHASDVPARALEVIAQLEAWAISAQSS